MLATLARQAPESIGKPFPTGPGCTRSIRSLLNHPQGDSGLACLGLMLSSLSYKPQLDHVNTNVRSV